MDILTSILQAPLNTILIFAGLVFIFLALFEIGKGGSVKLRQGKTNFAPIAIGAVLLLGGVFYKTVASPASQPTQEATEIPATQPPTAPTPLPVSTEPQVATDASTNTPEPTAPPQAKSILDGCFTAQTWTAKSTNSDALKSVSTKDNCLNANSLGISVEAGGKIRLFTTAPKTKAASGISIPVTDQSVIEFRLTVNSLYIVYPEEAAYITFGIAPSEDPMAERGSGRLKLVVEKTGDDQTVFYFLSNAEQSFGSKWPNQHPSYRRTYSIRLQLKSISMEIYLDGSKFKDVVTIPPGSKVFNIGYYLPVQAGADIEITDLTIDGKSP